MNTVTRKIIEIDEDLCNGCGEGITGCPEGAIQLVDGKARLVSEFYCDGLGACVGECPTGAIRVIEREAAPYDERSVIQNIARQGPAAVQQHLDHLKDHGETDLLAQAHRFLGEMDWRKMDRREMDSPTDALACGCPGSQSRSFESTKSGASCPSAQAEAATTPSALTHWPVQLHLLNPLAPHYQGSDFLLAADCVAYALGDFHSKHLKNRTLGIACPKLDQGQEIYSEKLRALIERAKINTLTVMIMQVPCCQGLLKMAVEAVRGSSRKVPIKALVVGVEGEILKEEWV